MKTIFFLLLFLVPILSFSQLNINKTKAEIKKEVLKFNKANPTLTLSLKETDSTFVLTKIKEKNIILEKTLLFDNSGKCIWDKTLYNCAACYKEDLEAILTINKYAWEKINENQYVSKFEERLMIELPAETNTNSMSIIRMEWTKVLYDLMRNK